MPFSFSLDTVDLDFVEKMKEITAEPFKTCMQCGTCTVVCPMTTSRRYSPLTRPGYVRRATHARSAVHEALTFRASSRGCGN